MQQRMNQMESNETRHLELKDLADRLGVSKSYLSRRARNDKPVGGHPVGRWATFERKKLFGEEKERLVGFDVPAGTLEEIQGATSEPRAEGAGGTTQNEADAPGDTSSPNTRTGESDERNRPNERPARTQHSSGREEPNSFGHEETSGPQSGLSTRGQAALALAGAIGLKALIKGS